MSVEDWVRVRPDRLQRAVRWVTRRPGRLLFRYRAFSSERVPRWGGFIIAPNHGSYFDGPFFAHGFDRTVRFMAKYQALEWPVIGRIIRWGGGFPVRRGEGAAHGLQIARAVLRAGDGLMMFMEGRLVREPGLGAPRNGLALLALQTGVPVVPVAAWGNKPAPVYGRPRRPWRRPRITIVWGEPMRFDPDDDPTPEVVAAVRDEIWAEVARLHEVAHYLHHLPDGRPATFDIPARPGGGLAQPVRGPWMHTRTCVTPLPRLDGSATLVESPRPPAPEEEDVAMEQSFP